MHSFKQNTKKLLVRGKGFIRVQVTENQKITPIFLLLLPTSIDSTGNLIRHGEPKSVPKTDSGKTCTEILSRFSVPVLTAKNRWYNRDPTHHLSLPSDCDWVSDRQRCGAVYGLIMSDVSCCRTSCWRRRWKSSTSAGSWSPSTSRTAATCSVSSDGTRWSTRTSSRDPGPRRYSTLILLCWASSLSRHTLDRVHTRSWNTGNFMDSPGNLEIVLELSVMSLKIGVS